jgi:RNA polymerase sigma-70 factor (ECF subfamily)
MRESTRDVVVQEIARHQLRLRGLLRCLLARPSDVDDLLQEVNLVLWEKADEFQPETDFWAWASQIARFKALNQARKLGRERLVFDLEILERVADVARERLQTLDRRRVALELARQDHVRRGQVSFGPMDRWIKPPPRKSG